MIHTAPASRPGRSRSTSRGPAVTVPAPPRADSSSFLDHLPAGLRLGCCGTLRGLRDRYEPARPAELRALLRLWAVENHGSEEAPLALALLAALRADRRGALLLAAAILAEGGR